MYRQQMRILFVCMGNICRSPTAEGVTRKLLKIKGLEGVIKVDSAGTHGYHAGQPPDPRARKAALRRGIDLSRLRARQVDAVDFERFDLLLAMDRNNLDHLERACPEALKPKLGLLMRYALHFDVSDVPDPFYGSEAGFDLVLDMVEDAAQGLVETLR